MNNWEKTFRSKICQTQEVTVLEFAKIFLVVTKEGTEKGSLKQVSPFLRLTYRSFRIASSTRCYLLLKQCDLLAFHNLEALLLLLKKAT